MNDNFAALDDLMRTEAGLLRDAFALTADRREAMLSASLGRIRAMESRSRWTAPQAVALLRSLLTPFCGLGTARATIDLAVRRSTGTQKETLEWALFVVNLSEAIESVCGSATGRLVGQVGQSLAVEES